MQLFVVPVYTGVIVSAVQAVFKQCTNSTEPEPVVSEINILRKPSLPFATRVCPTVLAVGPTPGALKFVGVTVWPKAAAQSVKNITSLAKNFI
jgi:hypothetical protein